MIEKSKTERPFEQPNFNPLQRIPDIEIPALPNTLNIESRKGTGKRVSFLEPETHERWDIYLRHLNGKLGIKYREFFCAEIPPVNNILLLLRY